MIQSALLVTALTVCAVSQTPAASSRQSGSSVDARPLGMWFQFGAGVGDSRSQSGGAALSASGNVQVNRVVWTARLDGVFPNVGSSNVTQLAALIGVTTRRDARFASASVGVAYVGRKTCVSGCGLLSDLGETSYNQSTTGLAFAAETALRAGDQVGVGIGLTSFANLNSLSSFVGIGLSFSLGQWR